MRHILLTGYERPHILILMTMDTCRKLDSHSLVSVLVPIYNEAENVEPFVCELHEAVARLNLAGRFELVFCDDGSRDGSGQILDRVAARYPEAIRVIHLARNFGHSAALSACLAHAFGDVVIVMDGDMQDDPAALDEFLRRWSEGFDVVYAIRTSREENAVLRSLFWLFYRLLRWMASFDLPLDAGNFGLMDRVVADHVRQMPEHTLYLPGLRAWVGFRQVGVRVPRRHRYDRKARVGLFGLWNLAMDAIFSFSNVPLFGFSLAGTAAITLAAVVLLGEVIYKLLTGGAFTSTMTLFVTVAFFGGINMLGIAVLGKYITRIYDEVKARPKYIVSSVVGKAIDK